MTLQEKDEIRLLHLNPGSETAPIVCTLSHVKLSQKPRYEALSYRWGAEVPSKTLEIDNKTRHVRENLYFALKHLRHRRRPRIMWVDALCINQADEAERSHQVFRMSAIYSQARRVCVWLGLANTCAHSAFQLLKRMEMRDEIKLGIIRYPEEWYDMAQLCQRRYWDRLWIIQEVVLASKIELYCGDMHIPWDSLSEVLCSFHPNLGVVLDEDSGRSMLCESFGFCGPIVRSAAAALCRERRQRTKGNVLEDASLFSLLSRNRRAKCTDVRDKIFGLHSFAPACCRAANPVDYTSSA